MFNKENNKRKKVNNKDSKKLRMVDSKKQVEELYNMGDGICFFVP